MEDEIIRLTGKRDGAGYSWNDLHFTARLVQDIDLISYNERSDKEMEKLISWLQDEINICIGYGLPRKHLENIIQALDDVTATHLQKNDNWILKYIENRLSRRGFNIYGIYRTAPIVCQRVLTQFLIYFYILSLFLSGDNTATLIGAATGIFSGVKKIGT